MIVLTRDQCSYLQPEGEPVHIAKILAHVRGRSSLSSVNKSILMTKYRVIQHTMFFPDSTPFQTALVASTERSMGSDTREGNRAVSNCN